AARSKTAMTAVFFLIRAGLTAAGIVGVSVPPVVHSVAVAVTIAVQAVQHTFAVAVPTATQPDSPACSVKPV
ncbi:MAG: hypothetical protein LH617_11775, partial [Ramlibacter sp.]|nr:hypothetical protein [Ramlibacter sp.]